MYIEPNGDLYLLHNIPLDDTYNHTWFFSNTTAQLNHFTQSKYVLKRMTKMNYQRYDTGVIVVNGAKDGGLDINEMYDCNYILFRNYKRNGAPESKWFYAFVTSIEYVSPNATKVYYKIDYMQTWITEFIPKQCFVEREHSASDNLYSNLAEENINTPTYIDSKGYPFFYSTDWAIVVQATKDINYDLNSTPTHAIDVKIIKRLPSINCGNYDGSFYQIFYKENKNDFTPFEVNQILQGIQDNASHIVNVYIVPSNAIRSIKIDFDDLNSSYLSRAEINNVGKINVKMSNLWGDWKPKNNKMFISPFVIIEATDFVNQSKEYHPQYFGNSIAFSIQCIFNGGGIMRLVPLNYKNDERNYDETITFAKSLSVTYLKDNFSSWLQTEALADAAGIVTGAIRGGLTAGKAGAIAGAVSGTLNVAQKGLSSALQPDVFYKGNTTMKLSVAGTTSGTSINTQTFGVYVKTIPLWQAQIIDEYFTMFGYATNRVKEPNRNVRKYHTYVKTNGCVAEGNVPADDMREICRQYDKGITFWSPKYEMGVYNHSDGNPTLK